MAEADAVPLHYTVTQAQEVPSWDSCEFLDLWFTGMEGARLYAKFLRPRRSEPMPLVLQFHGYPGASRSFAEQASFAGMGMALIAMDCPGQAGYSEDVGGFFGHHRVRAYHCRAGRPAGSGCTMCGCTRTSGILCRLCGSWTASTRAVSLSTAVRRAAGWVWPVRR